jgi:N utilization substance protein A
VSKSRVNEEMIGALNYLEKEKGIKKEVIIDA